MLRNEMGLIHVLPEDDREMIGSDRIPGNPLSQRADSRYHRLSQLVLNPAGKDPRTATYASLVRDVLFDLRSEAPVDTGKLKERIEQKFELTLVPLQLVDEGLKHITTNGDVEVSGSRFHLTASAVGRLETERKEVARTYDAMLEAFATAVSIESGVTLDGHQARFARETFKRSLFGIFESLSSNALGYLREQKPPEDLEPFQHIITQAGADPGFNAIERVDVLRRALGPAIRRVFTSPTEEFSLGLLQTATKHTMFRILGADSSLRDLRKEIFGSAAFLLDTNILISALCEHSYRHDDTAAFLDAVSSVGIELLVSEFTLTEFATAVHFADFIHAKSYRRGVDVRLVDNEIARNFYDSRRHPTEWPKYLKELNLGVLALLERWRGRIVRQSEFEIEDSNLDGLRSLYRELELGRDEHKPESLLVHDARNILLVHSMRARQKSRPFQSPWFVSHDIGLRRLDGLAERRLGLPGQTVLSVGAAFELVYPFVWSEVEPHRAASAFTRIVASTVLPIPPPSAASFLNYVAVELELPIDQENAIRRRVESHALRRALEFDLERGDTSGALGKLSVMLAEAVPRLEQAEGKDRVISRLAIRIQEYQGRAPYEFVTFNLTKWQAGLRRIGIAKTNNEKKLSLEEFADLLVSMVRGLRVIGKNLNSAAEEVDRLVANDWRQPWGDPILVECKNWNERVGAPEITVFREKLSLYNARTGVLLAKSGITGGPATDAGLRVRECLRDGFHILPITYEELSGIKDPKGLVDLLEHRWYIPWD